MIVRCITVFVKEEHADDFIDITRKNREGSLKEPGILRFDLLRSPDNPGEFFLYEVYTDEEAPLRHKETRHYLEWKKRAEPMMDKERIGKAYVPVAPEDTTGW